MPRAPADRVALSPQELINCALEEDEEDKKGKKKKNTGENNVCPTRMKVVYDYIKSYGLSFEKDCNFAGPKGKCDSANYSKNPIFIKGFVEEDNVIESKLLVEVSQHPVVGLIKCDARFNFLEKGQYYEGPSANARPSNLLHAVLIVGYGTDIGPEGEPIHYWLVRNSRGGTWCDGGYAKIKREISLGGKKSVFVSYSYPVM